MYSLLDENHPLMSARIMRVTMSKMEKTTNIGKTKNFIEILMEKNVIETLEF